MSSSRYLHGDDDSTNALDWLAIDSLQTFICILKIAMMQIPTIQYITSGHSHLSAGVLNYDVIFEIFPF